MLPQNNNFSTDPGAHRTHPLNRVGLRAARGRARHAKQINTDSNSSTMSNSNPLRHRVLNVMGCQIQTNPTGSETCKWLDVFIYWSISLRVCRQRLVLDRVSVYTWNGRKREYDQHIHSRGRYDVFNLGTINSIEFTGSTYVTGGPRMTVSGLISVALDSRRSSNVGRARHKWTLRYQRAVGTRVSHRTNCSVAGIYATNDWNSTFLFKKIWVIVHLILS